MPDGGAAKLSTCEVVAPGDDMRPGLDAEFLGPDNAGEAHEIANGDLVDAFGTWVADVVDGRLTISSAPRFFAQVWMDHICWRPLAASGFRLTLNEGAEPSLDAPGPE